MTEYKEEMNNSLRRMRDSRVTKIERVISMDQDPVLEDPQVPHLHMQVNLTLALSDNTY